MQHDMKHRAARRWTRGLWPWLAVGGLMVGCDTASSHANPPTDHREIKIDLPDNGRTDDLRPGEARADDARADARPEAEPVDPRPDASRDSSRSDAARSDARSDARADGSVTPAARRFADLDEALRAVRQAKDPAEAIDAYSAGQALDRDSVALQEAYVRRLVELDVPQVAASAARRLVGLHPDSPLAWAVVAFADARNGNMPDALTDITLAARKLPDDPFVQRTAGQLLAWYDNAPRKPPLAESTRNALEQTRHDLTGGKTFTAEYEKASNFYKNPPRPDQRPDAGDDRRGQGTDDGAADPDRAAASAATPPATGEAATAPSPADTRPLDTRPLDSRTPDSRPAARPPTLDDRDLLPDPRNGEDLGIVAPRRVDGGYAYDSAGYAPLGYTATRYVYEYDYPAYPSYGYFYDGCGPSWCYGPSFLYLGFGWDWGGGWWHHGHDWYYHGWDRGHGWGRGRDYGRNYGRGGYAGGSGRDGRGTGRSSGRDLAGSRNYGNYGSNLGNSGRNYGRDTTRYNSRGPVTDRPLPSRGSSSGRYGAGSSASRQGSAYRGSSAYGSYRSSPSASANSRGSYRTPGYTPYRGSTNTRSYSPSYNSGRSYSPSYRSSSPSRSSSSYRSASSGSSGSSRGGASSYSGGRSSGGGSSAGSHGGGGSRGR